MGRIMLVTAGLVVAFYSLPALAASLLPTPAASSLLASPLPEPDTDQTRETRPDFRPALRVTSVSQPKGEQETFAAMARPVSYLQGTFE